MNAHTPGPWIAERSDEHEAYYIGHRRIPAGQRTVATVNFGFSEPAESEQHANARLIAAAPDMLAALEAVAAANVNTGVDTQIRDAIAKATL